MSRLVVFNSISIDGYFVDSKGDMSWAHSGAPDPEWNAFVDGNAKGGGALLFGRITYDLMSSYWPSPMAAQNDPVVAERMNAMSKYVFSKSMARAEWANTTILKGEPVLELRRLKKESKLDIAVMGSGSIVSLLAGEGLIDEYQIVTIPVVLGSGRTLFEGIGRKVSFRLIESRAFKNGNVFSRYGEE